MDEEHRSLTRPTLHSIAWITATRGMRAPITLIAVAVLARLLTPADFGIVAIGMIFVTFSDTLIDGSFGMVLIQRRKITPAVIGATLFLSAALALVVSAGVAILSPFIEREFDFPQLSAVLLLLAAALPITAITAVTSSLLQRALELRILSLIGVGSQLAYVIAAIGFAVAGMGLWSLVWAQMLQWLVDAALQFLTVRKKYRLGFSLAGVRDVLGTGGMFTISKMLKWAANSADKVIIGRFLGASELGFYSRASTLMRSARQLAGAGPMRVLFSSFAKMQHDPPRMRKAYNRALSASLIVSTLVSGFVIVDAELIVRILLGPQWLATIPIIQLLFFAFIPKTAAVVAEAVPLAFGLGGASALREGAQLTLVIIGAAIGAQFGVVGAAAGVCIAFWLFYVISLKLVHTLLQTTWLEMLGVHSAGIAVALPPVLLALGTAWLVPDGGILLQLVPAAVFAIAALVVLLVGPASLVSDDVVRARALLHEKLQPYAARFVGRS
ncbi:MAG TPA: lipopolysaccharide biosynthesis protein [Sphingomicrobium sp.]|nr:lipopolysaccharide biosynthesis protein [Sphingomicrobium sp.]